MTSFTNYDHASSVMGNRQTARAIFRSAALKVSWTTESHIQSIGDTISYDGNTKVREQCLKSFCLLPILNRSLYQVL